MQFNQKAIPNSKIYQGLMLLLICAFNPVGFNKGLIYTSPKIFVLFLITSLNIFYLRKIPKLIVHWLPFLIISYIATIKSPNPIISLFGQNEMGDGFFYYCLVALFFSSNQALCQQFPQILTAQIKGLKIACYLQIILMIIQLVCPTFELDIWKHQFIDSGEMPSGFFSHQGHAAAVLLITSPYLGWIGKIGIILSQCRAAILAIIRPQFLAAALIIILIFSPGSFQLEKFSSGRISQWQYAINRIQKSPWIGWGFNGYGQAHPKQPPTWKAHNMILDKWLDCGILGLISYGYIIRRSVNRSSEIVRYLVWGLFWFDCAQFSHLFWWSLSIRKLQIINKNNLGDGRSMPTAYLPKYHLTNSKKLFDFIPINRKF